MSILKIALTGGIACGKSSVSQIFATMAVPTIDLDDIATEVVKPNTQALRELVSKFGTEILKPDNTLNRGALRERLLKNSANQHLIEAILHPQILAKMQIEIEALDAELVVIEVPLLAEKNLSHLFDRAINVDCSKENQLTRLLKRDGMNHALAKKIMSAQASSQQRLALAEKLPVDTIENNADKLSLEKQVIDLADKLFNL